METPNTFSPEGDDPIFRRVWERVTAAEALPAPKHVPARHGPKPPCCMNTVRRMCGFLEQELRAWRTLRALAKAGVREAAGLAEEELRHARQLSSRLFLLCGVRYFPKEQVRPIRFFSIPEGLRACYRDVRKRSRDYDSAAAEQRDPELQRFYEELAKEDRALAQRLRQITDRSLSMRQGRPRG